MPASLLALMFSVLIALPGALYLSLAHPAWSALYAFDPAAVPDLVLALAALVQSGAVLGGWWLGALLCRMQRRPLRLAPLAALVLLTAALIPLLAHRLGVYGSYDAHARGAAVGLMDVALGYALIPLLLGKGAAAVFVAVELARDSRRVRLR